MYRYISIVYIYIYIYAYLCFIQCHSKKYPQYSLPFTAGPHKKRHLGLPDHSGHTGLGHHLGKKASGRI